MSIEALTSPQIFAAVRKYVPGSLTVSVGDVEPSLQLSVYTDRSSEGVNVISSIRQRLSELGSKPNCGGGGRLSMSTQLFASPHAFDAVKANVPDTLTVSEGDVEPSLQLRA